MMKMFPILIVVALYQLVIHHPLAKCSPSRKRPVKSILNVHDVKSTEMPLSPDDRPHSSNVTTTGDHAHGANIPLDKVRHLVVLKVKLDTVVHSDQRIGVSDCPSVVCNNVRYTAQAEADTLDLEELVLGLILGDSVDGETTLDVVNDAEVLLRLFDRDHV
jgi:hypothetical protein